MCTAEEKHWPMLLIANMETKRTSKIRGNANACFQTVSRLP
jgi:hypothetical protein